MITGADGGIGREITKKFAEEHAELILCFLEDNDNVSTFVASLEQNFKVTAHKVFFDLSDEESIKAGIKDIKALKLKIDVLVNCAGVPHWQFCHLRKWRMFGECFRLIILHNCR